MKITAKTVIFVLAGLLVVGGFSYLFFPKSLNAEEIIKKAIEREKKITSYYTLLETEINLGSSMRSYRVEVWFKSPHFYRVEVYSAPLVEAGNPEQVFVSDGKRTWIFSPEIGDFYELNLLSEKFAFPPYLLTAFLKGLSEAQEADLVDIEKTAAGSFYLLRVIPLSPISKHAWEKVWLHKKTFLPYRINIYNFTDELQQMIVFQEIILNLELEEDMFKI